MPAAERPSASLLTLRRLPPGYRLLYTGVLVFFVLGHAAGLIQQHLRGGLTPRGASEWVLGNEDDPDATRFLFPRSREEVLDDVWRRSLADVIPTLVVLALLFRSGAAAPFRGGLSVLLVSTALADTTGPALVAALGPGLGAVWWAAQVLLAGAVLAAASTCILEMWGPRHGGPRFHGEVAPS